jgi:hypothetical protein
MTFEEVCDIKVMDLIKTSKETHIERAENWLRFSLWVEYDGKNHYIMYKKWLDDDDTNDYITTILNSKLAYLCQLISQERFEANVHYDLFPDNEMTDGAKLGQEIRVLKAYGLDDTTLLYLYKASFYMVGPKGINIEYKLRKIGDLGHLLDVSPGTIKNIKGIGPARYKRIVDAHNMLMNTTFSNDYYDER